jgi:hypothetical protein
MKGCEATGTMLQLLNVGAVTLDWQCYCRVKERCRRAKRAQLPH